MAWTEIDLMGESPVTEPKKLETSQGAGTFTFVPSIKQGETSPKVEDLKDAIFGVGYYFYIKSGEEYSKIQRVGGYWNPSGSGSQMNVVLPKTDTDLYVKFDVIHNPGYYDLHPSTDKAKFSLKVNWTPLITIS